MKKHKVKAILKLGPIRLHPSFRGKPAEYQRFIQHLQTRMYPNGFTWSEKQPEKRRLKRQPPGVILSVEFAGWAYRCIHGLSRKKWLPTASSSMTAFDCFIWIPHSSTRIVKIRGLYITTLKRLAEDLKAIETHIDLSKENIKKPSDKLIADIETGMFKESSKPILTEHGKRLLAWHYLCFKDAYEAASGFRCPIIECVT